jgi:hypothetical protein
MESNQTSSDHQVPQDAQSTAPTSYASMASTTEPSTAFPSKKTGSPIQPLVELGGKEPNYSV